MLNVILVYIIVQLITNAYGLAVIESARPFVEKKLIDEGYHKNKNSLYRFNYTLSNVLKGFIPFYYTVKAINIVMSKGDISKQVQEQIDSKNFVQFEEEPVKIEADVQVIEDKKDDLVNNMNLAFEKPEKYTARRNDFDYLDIYEEPIDFIARDATEEDNVEVTPFINKDKVVEQVIVEKEVTSKDIAKAICDLDDYELSALYEKIKNLQEYKKNTKGLKLEKDVA